jgi:hypothetical protein
MMRGWVAMVAMLALGGCLYDGATVTNDVPDAAPDAPTGGRVTDRLIGLWTLAENGGTTVGDTSGVTPAVSPVIASLADVVWAPETLSVAAPVDINTGFARNRLIEAIKLTSQVTLEAWVTPASGAQQGTTAGHPARIATITVSNIAGHYLTLGQLDTAWVAQVKTMAAGVDAHGGPNLTNGTVATTRPTHLVVTADATHRRLYVDGVMVEDNLGGSLGFWDPMRTFELGGDPGRRNTWLGTLHLVALYDQALTPEQVAQNLAAGP